MTTGARIAKQFVILVVFLLVIGGIGYGGFAFFKTPKATPTPSPTVTLAPITVISSQLISVANYDYDFVAKVSNTNAEWGSGDAEYELKFYNPSNVLVSQQEGSFYILPGETKYILESPLKFSEPVARAEMTIKSVNWQKLDPISAKGITLTPRNFSYSEVNQTGIFGRVGGFIYNKSDFDLGQVGVTVLLIGEDGSIAAVGKTEILTFLSGTTRGFETSWYSPFAGKVNQVEVAAYTDVFENSNFLRQYERPEKFQQLY